MASKVFAANTPQSDLERDLQALGPAAVFPWHPQQEWALRAATDTILVVGGNRSGKSETGVGMCSRLIRREGPLYRRLRKPEGRPLTLWVAPQTDEKAKSLWEPRLIKAFHGLDATYVSSPHKVFRWNDEHGGGSLWIKSQEQGFMSFESDDVDFVLFDEEPDDRRVYASAKTRLATTNGVIALTFTPLNGMTWTYDELYVPTAERDSYKIGDRVWRKGHEMTVVVMGMADNPEAVAGGGVARMQADPSMSPAEKAARLYGKYGFTEGLLFPMWADLKTDGVSEYLISHLPKDRAYLWYLTADPNKRHGALLTAIDHLDNHYVCAEHYAENLPDTAHADAYRAMLAEYRVRLDDVQCFADPGGAGAQAILNLAEVGIFASAVPKDPGSVAASIKRLRRLAHREKDHQHPVTGDYNAPKIYFLRSLRSRWTSGGQDLDESRLLWEFRQYRQKPNAAPDAPIKRYDDVVDCCLAGDTPVETRKGPVSIASLVGTTGELLTPQGWLPYEDVRRTRTAAPTVRVSTTNGQSIRCTPDHELLIEGRGWVPAGAVRPGDAWLALSPADHDRRDDESRWNADVPRSKVLAVQDRLLPPAQYVSAPGGMGACERPDPRGVACPPQGSEPAEQRAGESRGDAGGEALRPASHTGVVSAAVLPDDGESSGDVAKGRGVARVAGGFRVALKDGDQAVAGETARGEDLRAVRKAVPHEVAPQGAFLPPELQGGCAETCWEGCRHPDVCGLRKAFPLQSVHEHGDVRPAVRWSAQVVRIVEDADPCDVFNLHVPGPECFASAGGLVVHNCRYVMLAHADGADEFRLDANAAARAKLDPLSKKEAEGFEKMIETLYHQNLRARQRAQS